MASRAKRQARQPPAPSQPGIVPPYLAERAKEAKRAIKQQAAKKVGEKSKREKQG